eukprot:gene8139-12600_t
MRPHQKVVVLVILLLFVAQILAVCPHDKPGLTKWSTITSWNVANASVVIDTPVLLDVSPPILNSITVNSELIINNQQITLTVGWIRVNSTGSFIAGSTETNCQIDQKVVITFNGPMEPNNTLGYDPIHKDNLGSKGLAVCTGGVIDVQAKTSNVDWTFLSKTALKDSNTIQVEASVDWKAGDKIVIAGTDFSYIIDYRVNLPSSIRWQRGREFPEQTEERTIVSVNGNQITLDKGLNYTHWGQGNERAEVGLLSRNFVFQGDESSNDSKNGGHIIIRPAKIARFQGVELTRMGQMGTLGRYPIHFHWTGDKIGHSNDFYVQHSSVHHNFQRCIVIHNSNGILLKEIGFDNLFFTKINSVGYDTFGHCFFLEDGGERSNTFNRLLGILARPISKEEGRQIIPTDNEPSLFWFTNPNNTVTQCSAVGGKFGFWYVMPLAPVGISLPAYGTQDPYVRPRWTPLGDFSHNIAHSCFDTGLMVDEMIKADGTSELASYSPKMPPYNGNVQSWELKDIVAEFHHFTAYKCRRFGSWARGGRLRFSYFTLLGNKVGHNSPPGPNIIEHAYIVGETDNKGLAYRSYVDVNGRSRPGLWESTEIIKGVDSYDNGGPQFYRNITCVNFIEDVKPAGCIGNLDRGPFMHHSRNRYSEFKFINSNRVRILDVEPGVQGKTGDGPLGVCFFDIDGSITGVNGGAWIVTNTSMLVNQNCTPKYEWNAYICPPFPQGFVQLTIKNLNIAATSFIGTDGKDYSHLKSSSDLNYKATFHELETKKEIDVFAGRTEGCSTCGNSLQYMVNLRSRKAYTIRWKHNTPTPSELTIDMDSSYSNDWIVIAIPYPDATFASVTYKTWSSSTVYDMKRVNQLGLLDYDSYYWDSETKHAYFKMQNVQSTSTIHKDLWGFSSEVSDGRVITVKTICDNGNCYGSNYNIPNQPKLNKEDHFEVPLKACSDVTTQNTANAFIIFNPQRSELSLSIFHDKKGDITGVLLSKSQKKINLVSSLYSPIRAVIPASHGEWTDLLKGNIEIKLQSKQYPSGEFCGNFKSSGCPNYVPPSKPIAIPCVNETSFTIYSEGIPNWPSWGAYVWNSSNTISTFDGSSSSTVACGKKSLRLSLHKGGFGIYHPQTIIGPDGTTKIYPTIDTNIYKYFEMWVKAEDGYGPIILRLIFIGEDGKTFSELKPITKKYIDTFKIDDKQWSRIRVPLSDVSFSSQQVVRTIQLTLYDNTNPQIFYIDNMQFIKGSKDNMTEILSSKDIVTIDGRICSDIQPPPVISSSPSLSIITLSFIFSIILILIM